MYFNFDGLFTFIITIAVVAMLSIGWILFDLIFIDDTIKSTTPITPELQIIVIDNVVDTLYVYKKP